MTAQYAARGSILLDSGWPLPRHLPFTVRQAGAAGISKDVLGRLTRDGFVCRLFQGVYAAAGVEHTTEFRAQALSLVVAPTAIVTDRTAAWLHDIDVLAPGDHLGVPPLSVFQIPGNTRVRQSGCAGGERTFLVEDLMQVNGVWVTTPLRTALDLGRLTPRDHAIGALDGFLRLGEFSHEELMEQLPRFKGMRGVVQLRELAPLADPRSESPAEAVLRLRWLDTTLPRPTPQIPFFDRWGTEIYRLDLGIPQLRYGAEYNGLDWHSSPQARTQHAEKLAWLERHGWTVDVLERRNLFGNDQDAGAVLRAGITRARRRLGDVPRSRPRTLRWPPSPGR